MLAMGSFSQWTTLITKAAHVTRERTIIGSVSYRNRYWVYRIESATVVSRASLQVQHELLTGCIKQQIKGHSRRSPAARPIAI